MAKNNLTSVRLYRKKPKIRRPGVHAKSKTSKNKNSKNYRKLYSRQGK